MVVARGDTYYTFARQLFFNTFTVNGLVAVALATASLLTMAVAFRWDRARRA